MPSLQTMAFFAEISGVEKQILRSGSGIFNPRSGYFTRILSAGVALDKFCPFFAHFCQNGSFLEWLFKSEMKSQEPRSGIRNSTKHLGSGAAMLCKLDCH